MIRQVVPKMSALLVKLPRIGRKIGLKFKTWEYRSEIGQTFSREIREN